MEVQKLNAEKKELEAALQDLMSQEDQDKRELSRIRGVLQDEKRTSDTISKKMMVNEWMRENSCERLHVIHNTYVRMYVHMSTHGHIRYGSKKTKRYQIKVTC